MNKQNENFAKSLVFIHHVSGDGKQFYICMLTARSQNPAHGQLRNEYLDIMFIFILWTYWEMDICSKMPNTVFSATLQGLTH